MHKNGMEENEKWNLTVGITNCFIGVTHICRYIFTIPPKKLPMHTIFFSTAFALNNSTKIMHTQTFPFGICVDYMKLILYNQEVQRFSKNIEAS
jgi:hypothetical protein